MKKAFFIAGYLLISITAFILIGTWTLGISVGIPILGIFSFVLPTRSKKLAEKNREIRNEIIEIARTKTRNEKTQKRAEELAIKSGMRIDRGRGKNSNVIYELSNESLGKFLAHLLLPSHAEKIFLDIAKRLRRDRPHGIKKIVENMKKLNPEAAKLIAAFS